MIVYTVTADPEAEGAAKLLELSRLLHIGCHHCVNAYWLSSLCKMHTGVTGRNLHRLAMLTGRSVIKQWCLRQS